MGRQAACDLDCTNRVCGDGVLNATGGEVCDPGISSNCLATCAGYPAGQGCTNAAKCLEVKLRQGDLAGTDNTVRPQFTLVNNSQQTITLSTIKLRYWFTRENNRAAVSGLLSYCDLATVTCPAVTRTFVASGNEPVRDWLKGLSPDVRQDIGSDIQVVQWWWPIGPPLVDGRAVNGSLTTIRTGYPPRDDVTAIPDEDMVSLSTSMWW